MAQRRILRMDNGQMTVAAEARFESEQQLHDAVAAHPEVLPHEDLGLSPLVPLAKELDLGTGPMDLLAAEATGQLVIVEFKRGVENPDVRHVVAQVLDYGASLWRYPYDDLEAACARSSGGPASLAERARQHLSALGQPFDDETFHSGVDACLDSGDFIFIYCGRDLDPRTRRIMTYLAEGPHMRFLAVEMEYYTEASSSSAVFVPRTAFIPSWIAAPEPGDRGSRRGPVNLGDAPPEFHDMVANMDALIPRLGLKKDRRRTGWNYLPPTLESGVEYANSGVGVYSSSRGVEINFDVLRNSDLANHLLARLSELTGIHIPAGRTWPAIPTAAMVSAWPGIQNEVIVPYFEARIAAVSGAAPAPADTK